MTEFEFGGFSCRTEGSGGTLALLFSGFDRELFADVGGILAQSCGGVTLAEFGDIDWDRDYSPWEAAGTNGRVFSGGADRLVGFLPDIVQELSRRYGEFSRVYLCGYSLGGLFALYSAAVWDFPALGKGHIDFPAIFEELKAAGNDSPLSIEIEFTPEGAGSLAAVDQAVADSAAYLTAHGFEL